MNGFLNKHILEEVPNQIYGGNMKYHSGIDICINSYDKKYDVVFYGKFTDYQTIFDNKYPLYRVENLSDLKFKVDQFLLKLNLLQSFI